MDEAIEDSVGDSRLTDHFVPLRDRQLRGDQRRFPFLALFEDFQQVAALLFRQAMACPLGLERLRL